MSMLTTVRCRVSQGFMRLDRRFHPVWKQSFENGAGALFSVGQILRDRRLRKPMIVLGADDAGAREKLLHTLDQSDVAYVVWDQISDPPTADDGENIRLSWLEEGCDSFIAMGDGPVLDVAKAAAARCARRGRSIMDMVGRRKVGRRKLPPVIAIPTVAGTGAEALAAAIVADEGQTRFIIEDESLMPPVAVLDPELLADVPRDRVADAGMDGLCRAVEAFLAASPGDQKNRAMAAEAAGLFFKSLEECWNNGGDIKAREDVLAASRMAGQAASGVGCGYVRTLCRGVQTVCGIGFGQACGALLPVVLEKYGNHAVDDLAQLAALSGVMADGSRTERAAVLIGRIRGLVFRMGLPEVLEGVTADEVAEIADLAAAEANPRRISPVVWTSKQCGDALLAVCGRRTDTGAEQ